jgi:hypothetical protein
MMPEVNFAWRMSVSVPHEVWYQSVEWFLAQHATRHIHRLGRRQRFGQGYRVSNFKSKRVVETHLSFAESTYLIARFYDPLAGKTYVRDVG